MIIYLAMIFSVIEVLSVLFNNYFYPISMSGFTLMLNISVVFFCLSFFVLDLVTEFYGSRTAKKFIYAKIVSQFVFVALSRVGIVGASISGTQFDTMVSSIPETLVFGAISSVAGYGITIRLMENLKIRYHGKYLTFRYMASTFPGEVVFSLLFSFLSFSAGRTPAQTLKIFFSLVVVKFVLSIIFSSLLAPITKLMIFAGNFQKRKPVQYVPLI